MTREEFSKQLRELRDESGVILKNMCISMAVLPRDISRIEKALHNYSLSIAVNYLRAINSQLSLAYPDGNIVHISTPEDAIEIFKSLRTLPYRTLGEHTGVNYNSLRKIEVGETALSIDIFLKLSEYYNLKVILRKKP